ncbi:MAG TPA: carboxylate--amine ligase/circularly permuted type 2 ATP-grasp protein [Jatrophihabitans sp.]|nr:carboxylate--amine ligase/circularly permuted type 2 ATP-grasp protein [Jatrophihabitans sp.]
MPDVRTLGVEEELHVVDLASGRLSARAPELLRGLPDEGFSFELQRSTVETNTRVCATLGELREEIVRLRRLADAVAADASLGVVATGTAPLSRTSDFELTALGRFSRMQADYRFLVDDQLICGLQVHVGVADRDVAVRVAQRVAADLPTLLAMSASSPYWHGTDTGYSSFRTMVWQRWPTAGTFGYAESAADYDRLVADLIAAHIISDPKMAYFDVRPSAHVPTVELRVCDACPLADDAVLIAGLFRALVAEAIAADEAGAPLPGRPDPVHRAAMWRAARSGLTGALLTPDTFPVDNPATDVVRALVERLGEHLEDAGDRGDVAELTAALLARGDSSTRQRDRFAERGRVADVVALVVAETQGRVGSPRETPEVTAGYADAPDDEALALSGLPYPAYRPVFAALDELTPAGVRKRIELLRENAIGDGLTFGVGGEQRPFPVDIVPRIIPAHEWHTLAAGLTQRARAIELFLRDIYGPARIVEHGLLDWDTVHATPGWNAAASLLPKGVVNAPVIGFDLVRDSLGGWRVLEDNTRVPSGVGYSIGVRKLMREALPELTDDAAIRDPSTALGLIGRTLRACAWRPEPVVALLSDGADNSAWYEHRMIATRSGLLLVEPSEIEVTNGRVFAAGRRVDVLYLRLSVELADLRTTQGDMIGARILEAAQDGDVVLANAPGSGVADDKAMYCVVPDLISYYLDERPLLLPVPTYRCGRPEELDPVLGRLDQLVTKPVDGYGGGGVLIGPAASRTELDQRRAAIEREPGRWIAQEVVALSTHPTFDGDRLQPRHVDLRAFVYLSGTGPDQVHLADLALTRVAPAGSMVVNSSRGGGAKDTWIIADSDASDDLDEGR